MLKGKRPRIITAVVVIGAIAIGAPFGIKMFNGKKQANEQYVDNQTDFVKKPTDGSSPKDHSILENIQIAAGVLHDDPHFKGISKGHAITNMVVQNDQQVYTERRIDGDTYQSDTVALSSFKKIATQKFFTKDKIFFREGQINQDDLSATVWSNKEPKVVSKDDYLEMYGWLPNQLCSYVFKEDSIDFDNSKVVDNDEYFYCAEVILDTVNAVSQSKREVKENGGAISYPNYSAVSVSIFLDQDWKVQKMIYHDVYQITVKMGVALTAPVDSLIEEVFDYQDYKISEETKEYYSNYAELSTSVDCRPQVKEKNAMDYLSDSILGVALGGATLDAKVDISNRLTLDGKVFMKFDITSMDINLACLFDDLFISYDKNLKIAYKKYNYSVNEQFINHIFDALNIDVSNLASSFTGESSSGQVDGLMEQLDNLVLSKDGENVIITGNLNFDDIDLNLEVDISEKGENTSLKAIKGKINYQQEVIDVELKLSNSYIAKPTVNYVDLSSEAWIVDSIMSIASYDGYDLNLSFRYDEYDVNIISYIDKNKNVSLKANISNGTEDDIEVTLFYFEGDIYISLGSTNIKVTMDDISQIASLISNYIELPKQDINFNKELVHDVLKYVYDVFEGIVPKDNQIDISLNLDAIYENLGKVNLSIFPSKDGIDVCVDKLDLKASLKQYSGDVKLNLDSYITSDDLIKVVDNIKDAIGIVKGDTVSISIENFICETSSFDLQINGNFYKDADSLEVLLDLVYANEHYVVSFTEEENVYYVDLSIKDDEYKFSASKDQIIKALDILISSINDKNKDIDIENKIKDYIKESLNKDADIDNILQGIYQALNYIQNSTIELNDGNISFNLKDDMIKLQLLNSEGEYTLSIDNIDINDVKIKGDISLSNKNKETFINKEEYTSYDKVVKTLVDDLQMLVDNGYTYEDAKELINKLRQFKGIEIDLNQIKALGFDLSGKVLVDEDKNASLSLQVGYGDDSTSFEIYYYNNGFYLVWENYNLYLNKEDVKDAIDLVMSVAKFEEKEDKIYDTVSSICDMFVLLNTSKENGFDIQVDLSNIIDSLSSITLNVKFDDSIHVVSLGNEVNVDVSNYLDKAKRPQFDSSDSYTREDFDVLMDYVIGFKDYFQEGKLSLSFEDDDNPFTISVNDSLYILRGALNIKTTKKADGSFDKVTFSLRTFIEGSLHYYVALEYTEDETLYITFSSDWEENHGALKHKTTICLTRSQIITILKEVLTGIDDKSEIGKRLDAKTLENINTAKKILVDTGLIDKTEIEINKGQVNLDEIVPIVFKVLDFIKGAKILPNREDRSISFAKDYQFVSGDYLIETSSSGRLVQTIDGDSKIYKAEIESIKIGQIEVKGNISVSEFNDVVYADTQNAIHLTSLEDLADALFNSIEKMQFNVTGNIGINFLGINAVGIDVKVNLRVAYVGDDIKIYAKLDIPHFVGVTGGFLEGDVKTELFIEDDVIYMKRAVGKKVTYRKNTMNGFMNNIVDNVIYIFNFQSLIANAIKNSNSKFVLVPDRLLKSYDFTDGVFNMVFDLPNGLTTNMFSELKLGLSINEFEGEQYLKGITGNVTLFSVLQASFNLVENGAFGNYPDMSIFPQSLSTDNNYLFYKE